MIKDFNLPDFFFQKPFVVQRF